MRTNRVLGTALAAGLLVSSAAACGDDEKSSPSNTESAASLKGVSLDVAGAWAAGGGEQTNFQKVLDAFSKKTGAKVTFTSNGDTLVTVLASKIAGGSQPDVAMMPNQAALADFAKKGWAKPLNAAVTAEAEKNFSKIWTTFGSVDGKQYGVYFKGAN